MERTRGRAAMAMRRARSLAVLVVVSTLALAGCSSVGHHTAGRDAYDYGPQATLRVCVLHTDDVGADRVQALIGAVDREFAAYGIRVVVPWTRAWKRAGFSHEALFDDVAQRTLEAPCDRLVAFVDRNAGDFLWGLVMPEVLGAVDQATHTRGYVVATRASLNQLFSSPTATSVHEFYHLLGCPHAATMTGCYARIARLKRAILPEADFFPGVAPDGSFLRTREAVNDRVRPGLAGP
ncbi:hypothetical protein [Lysobacter arvi]|nr:hypothetical protein [Lysobacter arvi]